MSEEIRKKAFKSSTEELLKMMNSKADEECPMDDGESQDIDEHDRSCQICAARSACNMIASTIRGEFISIFSMNKGENK